MRFRKDDLLVERRYRLDPSLLKEGAVPDAEEVTLLIPVRGLDNDFGGSMRFLSDVAERMWVLLGEGETLDVIAEMIAVQYDVERVRARADLMALVDDLRECQAIVPIED
jgi:hypothetical protein